MTENRDRATIGARLREAREYRGFSQEDVAKYLGLSRSAISLIEAGTRRVDVIELRKLAKLYESSVDELTGAEAPKSTEPNSIKLVARATADLSPEDRSEVLRFAQFLRSRKAAGQE